MVSFIEKWSAQVHEARARSLELIADLKAEELQVPYLPTVNLFLWEVCHLAHFFDFWVLRQGRDCAGRGGLEGRVDQLFDSTCIEHEHRWRLDVPGREECLDYVLGVRDRVLELIEKGVEDPGLRYLIEYSVYHEDMHAEALSYTRQALGYCLPQLGVARHTPAAAAPVVGDAYFEGGVLELGAVRDSGFCFDNEKWAHPVEVAPFCMAKSAVSEGEWQEFVEDDGYGRRDLWSTAGWAWVQAVQAEQPLYWRRSKGGHLERRHFDAWSAIDPDRVMVHIAWFEAEAFACWAGRRLPTEAEWEFAAGDWAGAPAAFDWCAGGPVDTNAFSESATPEGCRQMMGNVWEWTSSTFVPYKGFEADMYADFSQSSFHTRKVLRGGSWATRSRLMRPSLRNFYQPSRRDIFAGLRTCALKA
ncbi:MAG TPA: ergothioneine biosynthesis protein EgtB [Planctomycetes bacterium]|nr:ergothioneine biosynthesis protein EgtB [Planctomycetota bacterium]HIL50851.1 ergothioneine biosynthesis protein EgtB [Planctomycetota bacterium]